MYIAFFELKKFKPFDLANIDSIKITPTTDTQIFIGDNGSGKSSLLNELNPFAAIKPMYHRGGYKRIDIVHDNIPYTLISDFSSNDGAHSFIVDGVNLNISKTAGIQNELVAKHLGYTNLIHDIIHLNYKMSNLSKSERKSLLLNLNPIDLSLVLDKHKSICGKIREYKNNLTMLHKKKQEFMSQLLSKDVYSKLLKDKEELTSKYSKISNEIYHLSQVMTTIENDLKEFQDTSYFNDILEKVKLVIKKINLFLIECKDIITRDNVDILKSKEYEYRQEASHMEGELSTIQNLSSSLSTEINQYIKHIEELGSEVTVDTLEFELKQLKSKLIKVNECIPIISEERYSYEKPILIEIVDRLEDHFISFKNKTIQSNSLYKYKQKINELEYKLHSGYQTESRLDNELKTINIDLSKIPQKTVTVELCNVCEYYEDSKKQYDRLIERRSYLQKQYQDILLYNKKLENHKNILYSGYYKLEDLHNSLIEIYKLWDKTVLKETYEDFCIKIGSGIFDCVSSIKNILETSLQVYENRKVEKKIEEVSNRLKYMITSGTPSVNFIKELLVSKQSELSELLDNIVRIETSLKFTKEKANKYKQFSNCIQTIKDLQYKLSEYTKYTILKANYSFGQYVHNEQKTELESVGNKLREIETTIKDQESVSIRLEDTLKTISEIEKYKTDLSFIEYGISPYTGFPHKQMVDYINVLISNANYVLSEVWSYPLQLIPIDTDDPLDCVFKIQVDDLIIPDISKLSKGQKAMVDLAWMFAFLVNNKLTDYPLYLDEVDDGLDPYHKQKLLEWLKSLVDHDYTKQLWMVHHEACLYEGFANSEVVCLMDGNIRRPEKINTHVELS